MKPATAEQKPVRPLPGMYAHVYAHMLPVARKAGYALALHGSMARDLDLVAIPWTPAAVSSAR